MRIISWNIERLARHLEPAQGALPWAAGQTQRVPLARIFEHFGRPAWFLLQEVRLRRKDAAQVAAARAAVPGYEAEFHLCNDPLNAKSAGGRHYGVAIYRRHDAPAARWQTLPWDTEGRVLMAHMPSAELTLVNWYGVNGTDRPYYNPATGVAQDDRHAFKLRSQEALREACLRPAQAGRLIVMGDLNVTPEACDIHPRLRRTPPHVAARQHMQEVFKGDLDLVDVYRHLHPNARQYTWFNRAAPPGRLDAARVDYALVSARLLPQVRCALIHDDPSSRFGSDHAPIEIELPMQAGRRGV